MTDYFSGMQAAPGQAMTELTIRATAATLIQYMDLAKQRDAWQARIEHVRSSFEKYGRTEEVALDDRRLRTDLARFAIEKLAAVGDSAGILALFKDYNAGGPDYLGKVIEAIALTYQDKA